MKKVLLLCLALSPVFAEMPSGPLKQMAVSTATPAGIPDPARPGHARQQRLGALSAAELRAEIESASTIEVSFEKTMEIKDSEKSFITEGKIYYRKDPLLFRAEMPSEVLQLDADSRKHLVKKYKEIYVDEWSGGNPLLMYFDIPGGFYESSDAPRGEDADPALLIFRADRDGDEIEAIYDRKEKMLKSVRVENAVMTTFTEIKSWKKDVPIAPGIFDFPRGAKIIDMRK